MNKNITELFCLIDDFWTPVTILQIWTNGQVEFMNRTLKDATVKEYYYKQLKDHLYNFVMAYNYAKRLKTLKVFTPYELICNQWTKSPRLFILNPCHHTLGA